MLTHTSHLVTDGCSMWNYSEPIWVSLRHLSPGTDAMPAQWSLKGLKKQGGWSQEGCQLVQSDGSISTMRCFLLSNYAVLQVREVLICFLFVCFLQSRSVQLKETLRCFAWDFFLGSSRFPQLQPKCCESAPPCGLCLHCSAPPVPLHYHHYTHTASQVVCHIQKTSHFSWLLSASSHYFFYAFTAQFTYQEKVGIHC